MDKSKQKPEEDNKAIPASLNDVKGTLEPAAEKSINVVPNVVLPDEDLSDPIVPTYNQSGGSFGHSNGQSITTKKNLKMLKLDFSTMKHV